MLLVVCVAVATGAGGWAIGSRITSPADAAAAHQAPPASLITVAVARQSLASTVTAQGTVAYTGSTPITLTGTVGGATTQLVTRAPSAGATVGSGDRLLEVSGRPVFLLTGQIPMYRTFTDGMRGDDVRQLQQALTALGYGHLSSGVFNAPTQIEVKRWYEHNGYEPQLDGTGKVIVPSGEILFLPTLPVRVGTVTTRAGATASGDIATVTNNTVNIQTSLPAADAQLVHTGLPATLTMPDGKTMAATVNAIGDAAAPPPTDQGSTPSTDGDQQAQQQDGGAPQQVADGTTPLRLVARDPGALAPYANQAAKIDIQIGRTDGDVLAVPVAAVATSQDGSARVQVQRGNGQVQDVRVKLGLTADGLVEVSGTGLAQGDRVVVGSR
jgi:peptidoglycan hydrolase-like protein with peptidoglycan-binding domain